MEVPALFTLSVSETRCELLVFFLGFGSVEVSGIFRTYVDPINS